MNVSNISVRDTSEGLEFSKYLGEESWCFIRYEDGDWRVWYVPQYGGEEQSVLATDSLINAFSYMQYIVEEWT